jgi:CRISPR-associated endonuclease Cas2
MSRTVNNVTIICYDFTNNKLRRKFEKVLCDYGIRVQYSIFACRLNAERISRMRRQLSDVLDKYRDCQKTTDSAVILERRPFEKIDCLCGHEWFSGDDFEVY